MKNTKCVFCHSTDFAKQGFRKTENRGKIQKYKCHSCGKYFTNDEGFYRMRNSEDKITEAIDLYFSNLSSRKVRNHFRRHKPKNASHVTVLDWCRRYTLKVQNYLEQFTPNIGGSCYADDTEIDCAGEKHHFWVCLDWETRFINATHYSVKSGYDEAFVFLKKTTNGELPKYIQTDAAEFYPRVFKKLFFQLKLQGLSVEHKVINTKKTRKYNVRIETVFSKIKDRVDDFRGLKALWSAPILLSGVVLQHNVIEAHTTTGKIPAELAGLGFEAGTNRWLGLIKLASAQPI